MSDQEKWGANEGPRKFLGVPWPPCPPPPPVETPLVPGLIRYPRKAVVYFRTEDSQIAGRFAL